MSLLNILTYPDPRLRTIATPIDEVDADIQTLAKKMLETMYAAPGVGLAATQVNVHRRMLVADVSEQRDAPLVLINPEITARDGRQKCEEGCLSFPGIFADVERAETIEYRALDENGETISGKADGLLAVCIQHEIDHLDGKLFVDYLSPIKRLRLNKKIKENKKASAVV